MIGSQSAGSVCWMRIAALEQEILFRPHDEKCGAECEDKESLEVDGPLDWVPCPNKPTAWVDRCQPWNRLRPGIPWRNPSFQPCPSGIPPHPFGSWMQFGRNTTSGAWWGSHKLPPGTLNPGPVSSSTRNSCRTSNEHRGNPIAFGIELRNKYRAVEGSRPWSS